MKKGTVKWFNPLKKDFNQSGEKGFGFIVPDDGGPDIFVHHKDVATDMLDKMKEGAKVGYEIGETAQKKLKAIQVKVF